jgi:hypothetical protein
MFLSGKEPMKIISKADLERAIKKIHDGEFSEKDCLYSSEKKIFWLKAYGRGALKEIKMYLFELKNVESLNFRKERSVVPSPEKQVFFDWIDDKNDSLTFAFFSNNFRVEISVRKIDANFEIFSEVS